MRSLIIRLARLALVLSMFGVFATPARAAAPSNDTVGNATLVGVGFSATLDTTGATTDDGDARLNETCGAPATDASVWYALDGDGTRVTVDVRGSSYSAGVLVATGSAGNLETLTCASEYVSFLGEAGTRYYIMAFDDQLDEAGIGGTLKIAFTKAVLQAATLTVDAYGQVNARTGIATLTGTYSCTAGAEVLIFSDARQRVGRGYVQGSGEFEGVCDGTLQGWSIDIIPDYGRFAGGKALTASFELACTADDCISTSVEQSVKLRGGRK